MMEYFFIHMARGYTKEIVQWSQITDIDIKFKLRKLKYGGSHAVKVEDLQFCVF